MKSRVVMCSCAVLASITAAAGDEKATSHPASCGLKAAATRPACASQPASEVVLVRIGDRAVVTQEEFDKVISTIRPQRRPFFVGDVVTGLVQEKLLLLYVAEHPELVPEKELQAAYKQTMKEAKVKTLKELKDLLEKRGIPWAEYHERTVRMVARAALTRRGIEMGKDEALLKQMYDANPQHWNGARVTARHILLSVPLYATPAEGEAKRQHLARIREDIVSGKRAWDECVQESESNTKYAGGLIGDIPRYNWGNEEIAEAAWSLTVGQMSDLVEDDLGIQIIEATARKPGYRDFNDPKTKRDMKSWLEKKPYRDAIKEMRQRYAIVGVQAPKLEPVPEEPTSQPATEPALSPR